MQDVPLSDCTAGVIQEANKANNAACGEVKKVVRRRQSHNPYYPVTLTPVLTCDTPFESKRQEPNPDAPAFIPAETPRNAHMPSSYSNNFCMNETAYDCSVYGSPYYCAQCMLLSLANPTRPSYQLPAEPVESGSTSMVTDNSISLSSNSGSCGNLGSPVASTPIQRGNNLCKVYVDGRPMVFRGVMYAEVKVELRLESELFIVSDVPQIFGFIVQPEELVGRHVIVEGDRGVDLGVVVSVERSEQEPVKRAEPTEEGETSHLCVLRAASPEEIEAFHGLDQLEEEALRFCKAAIDSLNMRTPLQVQRAVFQFDRKKLTFTYRSDGYVEFKALLRALNRQYQCRIWMHQLNWELNCRQRRQPADAEGHRKRRREARKGGAAKKDGKPTHEAAE
ncbi:PSP1 family protein [Trypanosoma conorhini]|uniref:PSP1 family protein n=1 Tax=Trypanosoma conorhini TaxID=83891 RepID=A0A422MWZ6_9TRYP|nr:PSP1 family protein [Trypanosoma conorhini]RNE97699.1 PSP1 family protein [Trypanosoma conorhini]